MLLRERRAARLQFLRAAPQIRQCIGFVRRGTEVGSDRTLGPYSQTDGRICARFAIRY